MKIREWFKRRREGTKIILRMRREVVQEAYMSRNWGFERAHPEITRDLYLYYDMSPGKDGYEELTMTEFVKRLNFLEMISNSAFWHGFLDGRKDNKEMRKKYKKVKIYIKETKDRGWVRI